MQVVFIKPDGFYKLKLHMIKDSHNMQFKMPRVMRKPHLLRILLQQETPESMKLRAGMSVKNNGRVLPADNH